jgi:hypothetical protein
MFLEAFLDMQYLQGMHHTADQTALLPQTPSPSEYESCRSVEDVEVLIQDPITKVQYTIGTHKLSAALEQYGTRLDRPKQNRKTEKQIDDMIKKFCNARDLSFMKQDDAKEIVEAGRTIIQVPLKGKKENGHFNCLICPLTQGHGRGFDRKEDLKRHYQLHFKFNRFRCKHCSYANSRTDHMKHHIKTCHPNKDEKDYIRSP